jgi:hypothetical protein
MPYPTIQVTKINTVPFTFEQTQNVDYPVSPFVSAKLYTNDYNVLALKIRATLHIDSANTVDPFVEINPVVIDSSLQLYFDYNFTEERPKSLDVWYIELDYVSEVVGYISSVTSYLRDIDPETSRGTTTQVGEQILLE